MTAYTAVCALTDIDARFLADADRAPAHVFPLKRLLAVAACVAIIGAAVGGFFAWQAMSEPPLITSAAFSEADDATLITSYPMMIDPCYASPRDGDVLLFLELEQAMKHYENENVRFWVRLEIFSEDGAINFNEAETDAEVARLKALGYNLSTLKKNWIGYWGEDKHYTTVCAKMTADELNAFKEVAADMRYGYAFDFAPDEDAQERFGNEVEPTPSDTDGEHSADESVSNETTDDPFGFAVEPVPDEAADDTSTVEK